MIASQVFHEMIHWARGLFLINCVVVVVSSCALGFAASAASVGISTGFSIASFVLCLLILIFGLVGSYAIRRLRNDLTQDEDGKDTVAQELLECYFWSTGTMGSVLFIFGCVYLAWAVSSDSSKQVANQAAKFPEEFVALAAALGIDASAGSGAIEAVTDALVASQVCLARSTPSGAIRCNQSNQIQCASHAPPLEIAPCPSDAIRCNQMQSDAIRCNIHPWR